VSFTDTSASANAVQLEILRRMSGEKRLLLAMEMSLFARELSAARIRQQHPEWSEIQVKRELIRLAFAASSQPSPL
jgi:hypothetical protein